MFINRLKRSLWLGHHLRDSLDTDHNTDRAPRSEDTQSSQSGAYSICAPLPSFCLPLLALHRIVSDALVGSRSLHFGAGLLILNGGEGASCECFSFFTVLSGLPSLRFLLGEPVFVSAAAAG